MKRTWPIVAVEDVRASSQWYRRILGCSNNHPGDETFDQLLDADGTVLLCLHRWGEEEHPTLVDPSVAKPGNGLLLFFCVDDFEEALRRAQKFNVMLAEEPHTNPNTRCLEFSLRDPDGYYVTISAFDVKQLQ